MNKWMSNIRKYYKRSKKEKIKKEKKAFKRLVNLLILAFK